MTTPAAAPRLDTATVIRNTPVCREHLRLTLALSTFPTALAGQFVQLSVPSEVDPVGEARAWSSESDVVSLPFASQAARLPLLPRAFSIGGLRRTSGGVEIDVLYRVVGVATNWMASLRPGDRLNVMGPLGRPFPISSTKPRAALVIGGVGLPPLLWLAEALRTAGKQTVAILGARTREHIPLDLAGRPEPAPDARTAVHCAAEFAALDVPMVISTDNGTLGFPGTVVAALGAFLDANATPAGELVVYTCGPERMMQATAAYCLARAIECQVCMERPMACGVGTCQSCIVTVKSDRYASGRRYALCCSEGPVFQAEQLIWENGD
jgi:dihydroorotate dehydrogenase electron transfer subunit